MYMYILYVHVVSHVVDHVVKIELGVSGLGIASSGVPRLPTITTTYMYLHVHACSPRCGSNSLLRKLAHHQVIQPAC